MRVERKDWLSVLSMAQELNTTIKHMSTPEDHERRRKLIDALLNTKQVTIATPAAAEKKRGPV